MQPHKQECNFGEGSEIAKMYNDLMGNPLYNKKSSDNVDTFITHVRSSLAGEMPDGDYSWKSFIESPFREHLNRDSKKI